METEFKNEMEALKSEIAEIESRIAILEAEETGADENADDAGEEGATRTEWALPEFFIDFVPEPSETNGAKCVSHYYSDQECEVDIQLFSTYWKAYWNNEEIDMDAIMNDVILRWKLNHEHVKEAEEGEEEEESGELETEIEETEMVFPIGNLAWAMWKGIIDWIMEWLLPGLFGVDPFGPNDPQSAKDLAEEIEAAMNEKMGERRSWRIAKSGNGYTFVDRYIMCGRDVIEVPSGVISGSGFYYVEIDNDGKQGTLKKGNMPENTAEKTYVPIANISIMTDGEGNTVLEETSDYRGMPMVPLFE